LLPATLRLKLTIKRLTRSCSDCKMVPEKRLCDSCPGNVCPGNDRIPHVVVIAYCLHVNQCVHLCYSRVDIFSICWCFKLQCACNFLLQWHWLRQWWYSTTAPCYEDWKRSVGIKWTSCFMFTIRNYYPKIDHKDYCNFVFKFIIRSS